LKTNKLYKYINLLVRILIGVSAVWYIYLKLNDEFFYNFKQIHSQKIVYSAILLTGLLLFLNWGIEAMKWRYSIRKVEKISIRKAFNLTLTGITLGIITPNRIGEIPARALLLNKKVFGELTLKTLVSSFSQVVITFFIGIIGLIVIQNKFDFQLNTFLLDSFLFILLFLILVVYFKIGSLQKLINKVIYFRKKQLFLALSDYSFSELLNLLGFSFLRYVVFSFQFWLVLTAFGVNLLTIEEILLIPVCFLFASIIPTILISEIGVRGSVALFVFGIVSDMDIQIILASVLLWLINVALPALIGLLGLKDFKVLEVK
jgi:uncharacterized membrane protein YbhN (UPF0104 family)